jgi:uncharacterized phage protein (TIGR01671 family)
MREIKFRAWQKRLKAIYSVTGYHVNEAIYYCESKKGTRHTFGLIDLEIMQYTGLKDKAGVEIYIGDVCEFDNKDRFIVCMEDWLEVYADWIGEPECEDQTRDLYRIGRSKVIGNIYENKELIK